MEIKKNQAGLVLGASADGGNTLDVQSLGLLGLASAPGPALAM